jgi:alkanesulfonate monooxygenase SsuD/methylene tetrahydromethanopterin reductase-like flavin-dependent oxidoreductase (luciferase family)
MRVCLMLEGQEGIEWQQLLSLTLAAERAGLEGVFRSDHYASFLHGAPTGSLDAWATLSALAARTDRIRLGTLVSPVTFRSASVLAKLVVTADHISGGRVELGVGAGWFEPEHRAYGFPFAAAPERLDELDRQLVEIRRQWGDADDVWPKPLQRPHPPLIVGGNAKPRTVQAAIRFADEYNTIMPTIDEARERCRLVQEAASEAGRAPLRFSMLADCVVAEDEDSLQARLTAWRRFTGRVDAPRLSGTTEQVTDALRAYQAVGVDRVMLQHLAHDDIEMIPLLGELAHALAD